MGVPQRAIVPALASFNIGVEVGQIGVVLTVVPLLVLIDGVERPRYRQHLSAKTWSL
jgi:hypothetical protein